MAAGMTKTQLVRHLAEKTGTNNKTAAAFLLTLTDTAIKEAKKNGLFVLPGLGRLKKSQRKARMDQQARTGITAAQVRTQIGTRSSLTAPRSLFGSISASRSWLIKSPCGWENYRLA